MTTNELYKLEDGKITKDGHIMFQEDIIKDLNGWRNNCRGWRNQYTLKLHHIGKIYKNLLDYQDLKIKLGKENYATNEIEKLIHVGCCVDTKMHIEKTFAEPLKKEINHSQQNKAQKKYGDETKSHESFQEVKTSTAVTKSADNFTKSEVSEK